MGSPDSIEAFISALRILLLFKSFRLVYVMWTKFPIALWTLEYFTALMISAPKTIPVFFFGKI